MTATRLASRVRSMFSIDMYRVRKVLAVKWPFYVMFLPGLVQLILFHYYPMYGIVIAFQNYNPGLGFTASPWVGLANFQFLFATNDFRQILWNTLVIAISKLLSGQFFAVVLSLMLYEVTSIMYRRVIQSLVYLPHFLSWVVLAGILIDILGEIGLVNRLLVAMGLDRAIIFLGSNKWFRPMLVTTHLWQSMGWGTIIYLATLMGIDPQLYEAAAIDGAGRWQRMWHITLPALTGIVLLIACLNLGDVFEAGFDQVLNLYNPVVFATGDILDTYVYREGLISARYSLGGAVGLFKSVMGLILILIAYRLANKYSGYRIF